MCQKGTRPYFMNKEMLRKIFLRTEGHCHFCGDRLVFEKYGWKKLNNLIGAWEADHVIQRGKGGSESAENCLPACVRCNRLRWHRKGHDIRELLLLGLIANVEINRKSDIGRKILELKSKRIEENRKRRRSKL